MIWVAACSKRPNPEVKNPATNDTTGTGGDTTTKPVDSSVSIRFTFRNTVNGEMLVLNTGAYMNENGDSFSVTDYTYYISNIRLFTDDGKEYKEPESYHLLSEKKPASKSFVIADLPEGNYTKITFLIGVDKERNVSGAQTGALDPLNGMFWDWNTGYIMARMEGKSPVSPSGNIAYHAGGFQGLYSVLQEVSMDLPSVAVAAKGKQPVVYLRSDVAEWFKTPVTIDFATMPLVASIGANAATIAANYADMFSIDSVGGK